MMMSKNTVFHRLLSVGLTVTHTAQYSSELSEIIKIIKFFLNQYISIMHGQQQWEEYVY